jgi:hypothetical protein
MGKISCPCLYIHENYFSIYNYKWPFWNQKKKEREKMHSKAFFLGLKQSQLTPLPQPHPLPLLAGSDIVSW